MTMKQIPSDVSADVLIHNFGKKPNPEVKAKMMAFIDAHKDETMKVTEETLPSPEEEIRREYAHFEAKNAASSSRRIPRKQHRPKDGGDSSSGGTASPSS